jgi:hypothetical protein
MAVVDFYSRWSRFFSVMADEWWELRFAKRHRPSRGKSTNEDRFCSCGVQYGHGEYYDEDAWYHHKQAARDEEYGRRWK